MRLPRLLLGATSFGFSLSAGSVAVAQQPMNAQGVREAVVRDLIARSTFRAGTQFISDSLELAPFVKCHQVGSTRRCTLADTVPVVLLRVTLYRPDSARVLIGTYRMFYSRCPSRTPIDPPIISVDDVELRTLRYQDGSWREVGPRGRVVC